MQVPARILVEPRQEKSHYNVRTPQAAETILKAFRIGLNLGTAASLALISRATLARWRAEDEDFDYRCAQAQSEGKADMTMRLWDLARKGNTAAVIFWLKTRTDEFREVATAGPEDATDNEVETRYL